MKVQIQSLNGEHLHIREFHRAKVGDIATGISSQVRQVLSEPRKCHPGEQTASTAHCGPVQDQQDWGGVVFRSSWEEDSLGLPIGWR